MYIDELVSNNYYLLVPSYGSKPTNNTNTAEIYMQINTRGN